MMSGLPSREEIYDLIKSHKDGITLEEIAKQYQISPQNSTVLIFMGQLLADGKIRTEMCGEKLYCIAIEPGPICDKKDKIL